MKNIKETPLLPHQSNDSSQGILLINKPTEMNSFRLVSILRKITNIKKIGFAGTLDPFATGVMIMLIGRNYTRLSEQFSNSDKEYIGTVHLGIETDSYDCDGKILSQSDRIPSLEEVKECLKDFQGEIKQIPPMFSAKKIQGKKLYTLARKGIEVKREPNTLQVQTTLLDYSYPELKLQISCSKGTYIRSIAHDIGIKLNTGAHLSQLARTRCGPYLLRDCLDLDKLSLPEFIYSDHLIKADENRLRPL